MKDCSVYLITNTANGSGYIGSTCEIDKRWARHKRDLTKGNHDNRHLQRAWDKYGADAFTIDVLEYCSFFDLMEREQFWLNTFWARELAGHPRRIYNICPTVGRPASSKGRQLSEEHKRKIAAYRTGKPNPHGGYRKPRSEETKRLMSNKMSGEGNHRYGKIVSQETRAKLAQKQREAWARKRTAQKA